MRYENVKSGIFLARPNRFLAEIDIDGAVEVCHVKNTGRCAELFVPGATVFVEHVRNPARKTAYDLIAVYKGDRLFNIDSQAPNRVFGEWLAAGKLFPDIQYIKPECRYGNSRFDFYAEYGEKKAFIEVKGVTLEENGALLFPDAPTERGVKHLRELCACVQAGFDAYAVFVAQTEYAEYFAPNRRTHPAFAEALLAAADAGVQILCVNCHVQPEALFIKDFVPVRLDA